MNVPATFEVRSLLALPVPELISWERGGEATNRKIGSVPGDTHVVYPLLPPPKKNYAYRTDYLSLCTCFPAILDWSFEWGLRTPNLGEGEAVGGRGQYRSKEHW